MEDARSLKTMDAPRQKLMKDRATVVATTTLGFVSAAASRPSCEDIYINSILRLSARTTPPAKASAKVPRGDEPRGNRVSPQPVFWPLPGRRRRRRGEAPPCAPPVSIPRKPRAGQHPWAAPPIRDLPGKNNPARVRE